MNDNAYPEPWSTNTPTEPQRNPRTGCERILLLALIFIVLVLTPHTMPLPKVVIQLNPIAPLCDLVKVRSTDPKQALTATLMLIVLMFAATWCYRLCHVDEAKIDEDLASERIATNIELCREQQDHVEPEAAGP